MDYNNSSRRFRPWDSRVMALSIKCDSLALRTESREEWIFSSGIGQSKYCIPQPFSRCLISLCGSLFDFNSTFFTQMFGSRGFFVFVIGCRKSSCDAAIRLPGGSPPRSPTSYTLLCTIFNRKGTPLVNLLLTNCTAIHIPIVEPCIPFDCCK